MTSLNFLTVWHVLLVGDYNLIHLHNIETSFVLPILRLKYKVISTAHGHITPANKWGRFPAALMRSMEIPFARLLNTLTNVSHHDAVDLGSYFHRSVIYILNSVNLEPQLDLVKARIILDAHYLTAIDCLVFAAGRIVPLKGAHFLLEALNGFGRSIRLLMVGDLTHSADYAHKLRHLSDERVIYLPFLPSRVILLALVWISRLFIFPSTLEAMSTILNEAASVGAPILCSNIPGNLAVLPKQALLFSSQNLNDLREKLAWALAHPEEMKIMGMKSQTHVRQNFELVRIVGQYT